MKKDVTDYAAAKIEELEQRLAEAEQLIEAIKAGEVDAFALNRDSGPEIFTLQSGDFAYRVLVENFGEGALNLTEDGLIVYTNTYFHELLHLSYESVIGHSIFDLIHPVCKEVFEELFAKGMEGQSKGEVIMCNGDIRVPVYVSLTSLRPNLSTVGIVVTDLSEKKEHEKVLEEKNEFIETLLDSSVDMIIVVDEKFRHVRLNKKARDIYQQFYPDDPIGKTIQEVNPRAESTLAFEDLKEAFTGKPVHRKEYKSADADRYFDIDYVPIMQGKRVDVVMIMLREVTESVEAKQKVIAANVRLKERNDFIETIIESSHELIAVYGPDCTLLTMNRAVEIYMNRSRHNLIGKKLQEIYPDAVGTKAEDDLRRALNGEFVQNEPFHSPLTGRYIQNYLTPLFDHQGKVYAALAIAHDVTEIRNANKQLEEKITELAQSNTELASFSYIASHDLQEPLRKIQTFSNRILDKGNQDLSPLTLDYLTRIISASHRMQNLITALLNYSRMNTSELDFASVDLNQAVVEVKTNLAELFEETKAVVNSDPLPTLDVIPLQFNQLLTNIFTNAIKYHKQGVNPVITIKSEKITNQKDVPFQMMAPAYYKISFQDNGIGFDSHYSEKIFELFQRLHGKQEYEGTGIGLAICKKIIQNHKGFIKAEGFPGEGAVFTIFIPTQK